ncbi:MAG TPA: DUF5606 domain-containing protein [Chitinophagaceae bacterium]
MEYTKIISVSGMPGLFELLSSKNDGALVRSLDDKNTKFVSSRVHQFSHLESIEVYTARENVNLADVFTAMQESDEKLPSDKDNDAIKKYFEKVYPDMDFDRVYASDMKKMIKWFDVLQKNKIDIKLPELTEEPEEEIEEKPVEIEDVKKPAVKKAAKKEPAAAKGKKEKPSEASAEAKPKKIARKKKED